MARPPRPPQSWDDVRNHWMGGGLTFGPEGQCKHNMYNGCGECHGGAIGKLVSDEDTARAWFDALDLHGIDEETIKSWPHQERTLFERLFALRIETLIRKRLAERLADLIRAKTRGPEACYGIVEAIRIVSGELG